MTHEYHDKEVQTVIAGLTKHPLPNPPELANHPTFTTTLPTTTPPPDMPSKGVYDNSTHQPSSLLLRRTQQASLGLELPPVSSTGDDPRSPPPTEAILSPLPLANRLHAGHTPIDPGSLSPLRDQHDSRELTPELDPPLTGALQLPPQPGDGTEDRIELKALDAELEKIAKAQEEHDPPPTVAHSRRDSRKDSSEGPGRPSTDDVEELDGVLLKKPKMNLGAPLGQA